MTDYSSLSKAQLIEEIERLRGKATLETQNYELRETRQQLEKACDRYTELYDFAPVDYLTLGESGVIQQINLTGAKILGQPRADIVGKSFSAYLDQGDRQHISHYLRQVCADSDNTVTEAKLAQSRKDVRLESTAMTATAGLSRGCRTIMTDITRRKQNRQALEDSEFRWRFALEGAGDGVWDWNIETGDVMLSKRWKEILGYAEHEIENRHEAWETRIHPDDKPQILTNRHAYLDGKTPTHTNRYRLKCKDGSWKWVLGRGMVVSRDADGKPLRMLGTLTDISQTHALTERLQQSHDLLVDLSEMIPGFVYQYRLFPDGHSSFPVASAGIRDIFELTPERVRNDASPLFARVHPEDRDGLNAVIQESARTLQPCHHEFRVILPKQGVRWRMADARPVKLDDGSVLWHGFTTDITPLHEAEQRAQELLRQNRLIIQNIFDMREEENRQIARDLHDDLGQWLTAIQAEAEAIRSLSGNGQNPAIHDSAQAINHSASEMHKSIRTMLHRLRPSLLDAQGLADSLQELMTQWRKRHPGIACDLILDGDLAGLREDINITIYRIVQEALTNITRHAQASQVTVKLHRTTDEPSATEVLLLAIEDDGIGIDTSLSPKGLGLLGMRERTVAIGGNLDLHSSPGHGTNIEIRLPLTK